MSQTINKILIIGPSWIGDMVMAQALFKALKSDNPNVIIDVLALDNVLGTVEVSCEELENANRDLLDRVYDRLRKAG